jgi:tRNA(fMet)-specific endonuclease VapC
VKRLLDTNAYSALKRGDATVTTLVRASSALVFSTIVAGELIYGFRNGSRMAANRRELDDFLSRPRVQLVPVTMTTADRFSMVMTSLKRKGKPIPINDVWIAAQSLETGAELVTYDAHFEEIDGLALCYLSRDP